MLVPRWVSESAACLQSVCLHGGGILMPLSIRNRETALIYRCIYLFIENIFLVTHFLTLTIL